MLKKICQWETVSSLTPLAYKYGDLFCSDLVSGNTVVQDK